MENELNNTPDTAGKKIIKPSADAAQQLSKATSPPPIDPQKADLSKLDPDLQQMIREAGKDRPSRPRLQQKRAKPADQTQDAGATIIDANKKAKEKGGVASILTTQLKSVLHDKHVTTDMTLEQIEDKVGRTQAAPASSETPGKPAPEGAMADNAPEAKLAPTVEPAASPALEPVPPPDDPAASDPVEEPDDKETATEPKRKKGMKPGRRLFLAAIGLLALALTAVGVWLFLFRQTDEPAQQTPDQSQEQITVTAQSIEAVQPIENLQYTSDEGQSWRDLDELITIEEGYWIRTGERQESESFSTVMLSDGSEIRFDTETTVEFNVVKSDEVAIALQSGRAYVRVANVDNRSFNVSTRSMRVDATGTAFVVFSSIAEDRLEIYEGAVVEREQSLSFAQGQGLTIENADNLVEVTELDVNEYGQDEFVLWNRDQDIASSLFSGSLGILDDIEPPELAVSSPINDTVIVTDPEVATTTIEFTGTSEAGSEITVSEGDVSETVTANGQGQFTVVLSTEAQPEPGQPIELTYTVVASDDRGNETRQQVGVVLESPEVEESITLAAIATPGVGLILNWTLSENFDPAQGLQIVWDTSSGPTFPIQNSGGAGGCNMDSGSVTPAGSSTAQICVQDGRTYFVRACRFIAQTNSCDLYSNEIEIQAPIGGTDS